MRKITFGILKLSCLILFHFILTISVKGQISVTSTTPVTETFDVMGSGTSLPSNWKISSSTSSPTWVGASSTVSQQASSGSPSTGGTYNWGSSAFERAVGAMTSGSFASPNSLIAFYQNNGSSALNSVSVSYDAERYRINTAAASIEFYYSLNGTAWTAVTAGDIPSTSFATGSSAYGYPLSTVNKGAFTVTFSTPIAVSASFYLRWNFTNTGSSNSQGLAVDNISVAATFVSTNTISITSPSFGPYCNNVAIGSNVNFSSVGLFNSDNVYTAQISDASGSFSTATNIGTLPSSANGSQTIVATIPSGLPAGTGYKIRVISSSPSVTGSSSGAFTFNTVPASPGSITGNTSVCSSSSQTYSVTSVAGVSYNWTVPSDWSINSGQGTNSINVNVGSSSGNVQVTPSNSCGNGSMSPISVTVISNALNVSSALTAAGNGEVTLNWTSPLCFDEVFIIATDNASVTSVPTGDGSIYTASVAYADQNTNNNLSVNEYAVFKSNGTSVSVTGLTNGTNYTFKIFTRRGTSWSTGIVLTATPTVSFAGDFRTRASGDWTDNLIWQKTSDGITWTNAAPGEFPNISTSNVTIRNGHAVTVSGSPYAVKDLTINSGGKLYCNSSNSPKYVTIYGNIICNGVIGNFPAYDDLSFNIEAANCTISGSGSFACSRLRKSLTTSTTNLFINMNISTLWSTSSSTQVYNGSTGNFNITINAGKTLSCTNTGNVSIDGTNGADAPERKGKIDVYGTLIVPGILYLTTNNSVSGNGISLNIFSGGTVYANSINAQASGVAKHTLRIYNGGKLVVTGTSGWSSFSTTNNIYTLDAGSIVQYSAVGDQTIETGIGSYSNVILSGSGNKTPNATLNINANLDIQNAAILNPGANAINVGGNWTNYGTAGFEEGTSTVTFNGTGNQVINTTSGEDFYSFVLNKSSGKLNLGSNITVNRNLTLTKGIVTTGNSLFTWTNAGGALTSPSSANYTDSYICLCDATGTNPISFTKPFDGSKGFRIFNVKDADTWFPIGVDFVSPNRMYLRNKGDVDTITVAMEKGDIGLTNGKVVERIWYVKQAHPSTKKMQCDMSLFFTKRDWSAPGQDEIEQGYNYGFNYLIQKDYNDPNYVNRALGTDVTSFSNGSWDNKEIYGQYTIASGTKDTLGRLGIVSFSRFSVMNPTSFILPVHIVNFKAIEKGAANELSWESMAETGLLHYEVERSFDGIHYSVIGSVNAINNGLDTKYAFADPYPADGNNFYRIKYLEKTGATNYTYILNVKRGKGAASIAVYPNPVSSRKVVVQLNHLPQGSYELQLFNILGQKLVNEKIEHRQGSSTETINLPAHILPGTYFVQLNTTDKRYITKLEVQ